MKMLIVCSRSGNWTGDSVETSVGSHPGIGLEKDIVEFTSVEKISSFSFSVGVGMILDTL
tara:strand:+ start:10510 stop:10689 length:180 start_codon:yes stop_codon:yes gene_type:complete